MAVYIRLYSFLAVHTRVLARADARPPVRWAETPMSIECLLTARVGIPGRDRSFCSIV